MDKTVACIVFGAAVGILTFALSDASFIQGLGASLITSASILLVIDVVLWKPLYPALEEILRTDGAITIGDVETVTGTDLNDDGEVG